MGFSIGKSEALLSLAMASSIRRCCNLLCRGTHYMRKRSHTLLEKSWTSVGRTARKLAFTHFVCTEEKSSRGRQGKIITLSLDTELKSFLSHRNISEKCIQARYMENPQQETGLEKNKKTYGQGI